MPELNRFITERSDNGLLAWCWQVVAAERFQLTLAQIEKRVLEAGIMPKRYQRNQTTITVQDQLALFKSHVAIVGCGGLGCYVVEELARIGVGTITVVDPDFFEEHNLNRQLFSTLTTLGVAKVEVATCRVADINPAVTVFPLQERFSTKNGQTLLRGAAVAVDALDGIAAKLELAATCNQLDIPLVFGTIAGWYGYVSSQYEGDDVVSRMYHGHKNGAGIELHQGNLACTAATVASLEVAEICKIILGKGKMLHGRTLAIDLLGMEFNEIEV